MDKWSIRASNSLRLAIACLLHPAVPPPPNRQPIGRCSCRGNLFLLVFVSEEIIHGILFTLHSRKFAHVRASNRYDVFPLFSCTMPVAQNPPAASSPPSGK